MFQRNQLRYYGQLLEDKHIHERYFPGVRNRVFLELGAFDGITYSNTKFFEDTLGWSGVLIEAHPGVYPDLARNRSRCKTYHCAVSTHDGYLDFIMNPNGPVSSVKDFTSEKHQEGWHSQSATMTVQVPSRPLGSILREAGVSRIDFWSLDVEGGELEVLKSMDWSIPVYLLCIETQEPDRKPDCDAILIKNGFQFVETLHHNEIWVNLANRPRI